MNTTLIVLIFVSLSKRPPIAVSEMTTFSGESSFILFSMLRECYKNSLANVMLEALVFVVIDVLPDQCWWKFSRSIPVHDRKLVLWRFPATDRW